MPAGFEVPLVEAQLYLPLRLTIAERQERRVANFLVLGRLRKGVQIEVPAPMLDSLRGRSSNDTRSRMRAWGSC
jgi:hypothetical protein